MENLIKKTCLSQFTLIYFLLILSSDMLQENFLYYIIPKYCIAFFLLSSSTKDQNLIFSQENAINQGFFFAFFIIPFFLQDLELCSHFQS